VTIEATQAFLGGLGISTSRLFDRRAYGGRIADEKWMRSEPSPTRSRTRGQRTATGPMPIMISRSGRCSTRYQGRQVVGRMQPRAIAATVYCKNGSGLSPTVQFKTFEDILDAVICAWAAIRALEGAATPQFRHLDANSDALLISQPCRDAPRRSIFRCKRPQIPTDRHLTTAKAIGLTIPETFLLRAHRVIE
jgi:hypothetical protein